MRMNTTIDLSSLPDLPVHLIADFLPGAALASWCAVSHRYRDCLNQDALWKWRCNQETAQYLRQTPCEVQPFFISPKEDNSGLSAICDWRLAYMREVHLWNNWRNSRCKQNFVTNEIDFSNRYNASILVYKNDFIVINNNGENKLQLWNVKDSPEKLGVTTLPSAETVGLFTLSGDNVVVKQKDLVQIFEISIMEKKFLFKSSFVTSHAVSSTLRGNILVELQNEPSCILQVWNLQNQVKIGEHRSEDKSLKSYKDVPCLSDQYIVARSNQYFFGPSIFLVFRFPDSLVFKSKPYECINDIVVVKDLLLVQDKEENFIEIYCLKSFQLLKTLDRGPMTNMVKFNNKVSVVNDLGKLINLVPDFGREIRISRQNRNVRGNIRQIDTLEIVNSNYFLVKDSNYTSLERPRILLAQMKEDGKGEQTATWITDIRKCVPELKTILYHFKINGARTKVVFGYEVGYQYTDRLEVVSFW